MTAEQIKQEALILATQLHAGQFRKDGKTPYINYCIAVAEKAEQVDLTNVLSEFHEDVLRAIYYAGGLLHDGKEDSYLTEYILLNVFGAKIGTILWEIVDGLSRREGETYLDFILRAKASGMAVIFIKRCDLGHNMSDLKEGSLKDKYRMAEYILTH